MITLNNSLPCYIECDIGETIWHSHFQTRCNSGYKQTKNNYPASQAHHIFMASKFPKIADCPENIISLTPNQHFYRAHPENKTQILDKAERIMKEYFETKKTQQQ